jgi:aminomethyltransferase
VKHHDQYDLAPPASPRNRPALAHRYGVIYHIDHGASRKRVGFMIEGRAPVREGAEIVDQQGAVIGAITSGGFSPSLQKPIAMGYVTTEYSTVGTKVNAMVRGKSRPLVVCSMPFVPQQYYRG